MERLNMQLINQYVVFMQWSIRTADNSVQSDCMQWLIDTSPVKKPWTSERMLGEIMAIWFSSVHQLAMAATYALEDICLHPEYIDPLRKEIRVRREQDEEQNENIPLQFSKLELLDSFISESSRISPLDAVSVRRKALGDFMFTDGTTVSKGDWVCFPQAAMMRDEKYWESPSAFHGFRFASNEAIAAVIDDKNLESYDELNRGRSSIGTRFTDVSHRRLIWGSGDKAW